MSDIPVNREFWNRLIREVRTRTRGRADPEELLHAAYLRLLRYRHMMLRCDWGPLTVVWPAAAASSVILSGDAERHRNHWRRSSNSC